MGKAGGTQVRTVQGSKVDNRGARYDRVGTVINGSVSKQTIVHEKSVTYKVDKEDVDGLERLSLFVIDFLGERRSKLGLALSIVAAVVGVLGGARLPAPYASPAMYLGFAGVALAVILGVALQYRQQSRCHKCNTFYAMEEVGQPEAREVPARGGTRRTIRRFYQCRECGALDSSTTNEFLADEDDA